MGTACSTTDTGALFLFTNQNANPAMATTASVTTAPMTPAVAFEMPPLPLPSLSVPETDGVVEEDPESAGQNDCVALHAEHHCPTEIIARALICAENSFHESEVAVPPKSG